MKELNAEQRSAIESNAPRILAGAGPGSGKTHTLVERIMRLVRDGVDPQKIIVITFTNAAAAEIKKRIAVCRDCDGNGFIVEPSEPDGEPIQIPCECQPIKLGHVGTLHSFLIKLLARFGSLVGLPESLSVADDDQKEGMVEEIIREMGAKGCSVKKILPLLTRADLIDNEPGMKTREELVAVSYHAKLRAGGLLDFDTILHHGWKTVSKMAMLGGCWPCTHLFVDEYQDSGDMDAAIYEAMPCDNKFMVGDPDQAIYGFRGGNVNNILRLANEPGVPAQVAVWQVVLLEVNYRCGQRICDAAQRLIEHNVGRVDKKTIADRVGGSVAAETFPSPAAEMCFVAAEIQAAGERVFNDTAILCRTNRHADAFADHLRGVGIPVASRKDVFNPPDWVEAKMWLTVLANPWCDFAVLRYVAMTEGPEAAAKLKGDAALAMVGCFEKRFGAVDPNLDVGLSKVSPESRQRIHDACRTLSDGGEWTVNDLIFHLNAGEERHEVGAGVVVTTFHRAKGREWSTVYVVAAEEGVAPQQKADSDVEEERRAFYVALTRAKDRLVVTRCLARPAPFGPKVMRPCVASRFIEEAGL